MHIFRDTVSAIVHHLIAHTCDVTASSQCYLVAEAVCEYLVSPVPLNDSEMWNADDVLVSKLPVLEKLSVYLGSTGDHFFILFTYKDKGIILQGVQASGDMEGNLTDKDCDFGIKAWLDIGDARRLAKLDKDGRCLKAMTEYGGFKTFSLDDYVTANVNNPAHANANYYGIADSNTEPFFKPIPINNQLVADLVNRLGTAHERQSAKRRRKTGPGSGSGVWRKKKRGTRKRTKYPRRRRRTTRRRR